MASRDGSSIRPADAVLAVLLTGLGVVVMVGNIHGEEGVRIDSHSPWMIAVFLVATVPVLWWRRDPLVAAGIAVVAMAAHVAIFGWMVRCGPGLPLVFVLAYLVGVRDGVRRSFLGMLLVQALATLVLVRDSAAGVEILPVVAGISLGLWGIGRLARHRAALAAELGERNAELLRLRDARADLDVTGDRARLSAELDRLLDLRLDQLGRVASSTRREIRRP